jgi:membrane-bound inhibitor of C-type lysozyme
VCAPALSPMFHTRMTIEDNLHYACSVTTLTFTGNTGGDKAFASVQCSEEFSELKNTSGTIL